MTPTDLKKYFPNATLSTIARNSGLGELQPASGQLQARPLEHTSKGKDKGRAGVVKLRAYIRITFIRFCARKFDDGNLGSSYKQMQDVIAAWIGCDDSHRNIEWEYAQVLTHGKHGTVVKIERIT